MTFSRKGLASNIDFISKLPANSPLRLTTAEEQRNCSDNPRLFAWCYRHGPVKRCLEEPSSVYAMNTASMNQSTFKGLEKRE